MPTSPIDYSVGTILISEQSLRLLLVDGPFIENGHSYFWAVTYPLSADCLVKPEARIKWKSQKAKVAGKDEATARVWRMRTESNFSAQNAPTLNYQGSDIQPIKTALVLCAGLGTRLRPLTLQFPKPAIPFFEGPLVRYSFALLKEAGVKKVVINTHYLEKEMERVARIEAEKLGLILNISHETHLLGTAGAIWKARQYLEGNPFIVLNGDAFMALDLKRIVMAHQFYKNQATLAVTFMPRGESFGAVEATPFLEVRRISGQGSGRKDKQENLQSWHFLGIHIVDDIWEHIPSAGAPDIHRDVYLPMISKGKAVRVCPVTLGAWADMGTPERYLRACQDLLTGWCDLSALGEFAPLSPQQSVILQSLEPQKRTYIHPSAEVSAKAVLEGTLVGAKARIGKAILRQGVVFPGTFIADGECWDETLAAGALRIDAKRQV